MPFAGAFMGPLLIMLINAVYAVLRINDGIDDDS
jgi:hypothetical protein